MRSTGKLQLLPPAACHWRSGLDLAAADAIFGGLYLGDWILNLIIGGGGGGAGGPLFLGAIVAYVAGCLGRAEPD